MDAVFALADRISVLVNGECIATGIGRRDPRQRAGARRLSRRGRRMMLRVAELQARYGRSQVLFDIDLDGRRGRDRDAARPQRHGQDHDDPLDHGPDAAARRQRRIRRAARSPAATPEAIARRGIGLVPEGRQVFPLLTVRENLVATAANRLKRKNPWTLERGLHAVPAAARSGAISSPARCRAASSRCSRSAAR